MKTTGCDRIPLRKTILDEFYRWITSLQLLEATLVGTLQSRQSTISSPINKNSLEFRAIQNMSSSIMVEEILLVSKSKNAWDIGEILAAELEDLSPTQLQPYRSDAIFQMYKIS